MSRRPLVSASQSGELKGSLTVGAGAPAYMPDSFVQAQHEAAHAFFSANGYLDQATASELQVCPNQFPGAPLSKMLSQALNGTPEQSIEVQHTRELFGTAAFSFSVETFSRLDCLSSRCWRILLHSTLSRIVFLFCYELSIFYELCSNATFSIAKSVLLCRRGCISDRKISTEQPDGSEPFPHINVTWLFCCHGLVPVQSNLKH